MKSKSKYLNDDQYTERLQAAINLRRQGYYPEAAKVASDLLALRPEESSVHHTIGQIATATGAWHLALDEFGKALQILQTKGTVSTHASQFQATALGYAQSLMRFGRFEEAMPYWEAGRLNVSWQPWPTTKYWDGSFAETWTETPIKSLLVQCEGGYGDIFMFLRWLPLLKSQLHVERVGLMIFAPLADFCDWSAMGVDDVYRVGFDNIPFGKWEYSCSFMSLPAVFGVRNWADIPVSPWRGLPDLWDRGGDADGDKNQPLRLGFCWRAEENSSPIRTKSLPVEVANEIVDLADLKLRQAYQRRHPGTVGGFSVEIYSLSPERKDLYNTDSFEHPEGVALEFDRMATWRDTAAYLCTMDYVLTVDTAVAHLCGLLGVPCLVLIPKGGCWRWQTTDVTKTAWYGPQMQLYRQPQDLDWDPEDIVTSLIERIDS